MLDYPGAILRWVGMGGRSEINQGEAEFWVGVWLIRGLVVDRSGVGGAPGKGHPDSPCAA